MMKLEQNEAGTGRMENICDKLRGKAGNDSNIYRVGGILKRKYPFCKPEEMNNALIQITLEGRGLIFLCARFFCLRDAFGKIAFA